METLLRPLDQNLTSMVEGHWIRDPRAAAPVAPAVARTGVPTTGYGYDPGLGLWVPIFVSGGYLVEKFSQLISSLLGNMLSVDDENTDNSNVLVSQVSALVNLANTRLKGNQDPYLWQSMLSAVAGLGFRKVVGTDAGATTAVTAGAVTISFTGVNLNNRTCGIVWNRTDRTLHRIMTVVDPVGAVPGTITLETPIATASAMLVIPYLDVPHAWNSAADAMQTLAVVGDPPRISGPNTLISTTSAIANGTTQYPIPSALYARQGFTIVWVANGGTARTIQFNSFGKVDDAAWAGAGAIPAAYNINTLWQYTAGSTIFGAAAVGGGILVARMQDPTPWNSVMIEMVVTNTDGNTSTVTATYTLQGGTK